MKQNQLTSLKLRNSTYTCYKSPSRVFFINSERSERFRRPSEHEVARGRLERSTFMFVKIRLFCFQIFQEKETRVNILKQIIIDFIIIIIIVILQFYFCIFLRTIILFLLLLYYFIFLSFYAKPSM